MLQFLLKRCGGIPLRLLVALVLMLPLSFVAALFIEDVFLAFVKDPKDFFANIGYFIIHG